MAYNLFFHYELLHNNIVFTILVNLFLFISKIFLKRYITIFGGLYKRTVYTYEHRFEIIHRNVYFIFNVTSDRIVFKILIHIILCICPIVSTCLTSTFDIDCVLTSRFYLNMFYLVIDSIVPTSFNA